MQENPKAATVSTRWFVYILSAFLLIGAAEAVQRAVDSKDHTVVGNLTAPYFSFLDDLYYFLDEGSQNLTEACRSDTKELIDLAQRGDTNALKIFDASGKASSGILDGAVDFIGFYSECIKTIVHSKENSIQSKYCLINLDVSASSQQKEILEASWLDFTQRGHPPAIGICIPHSCSTEEVQYATNASLYRNFQGVDITATVCHTDQTGMFQDPGAIVAIVFYLIFFAIAIFATIYDFYLEHKSLLETMRIISNENNISISMAELCEREDKKKGPTIPSRFLMAFSFKTNMSKIFTVGKGDGIRAIHGLKFLSMALIILGHTFSFAVTNLFFMNPGSSQQAPKNFLAQILANGTFAVDTFYLISGILVALVTLNVLEKTKGKLHIPLFYFHRYFRLTPLFMAVIMFCACLLKYTSSGPNWLKSIEMYDSWCQQNWWVNAFYLHNFIRTENMCLSHTWYLATDMQMYLVTPLILIPLHRNFVYGLISMSTFLFATITATAVITAVNHYPAIPYINNILPLEVMNDYYKDVYIKTYCRMGPYIIGIAIGYLLFHKKEWTPSKKTVAIGWCLSIATGLTIIYLMWPANQGILPSNGAAAAYSALARTFWGASTGWIIVACYYGYGGIVNSILSCSVFVPLSRLTYCAYLIHPIVMNVYYGSTESAVMFTPSFVFYTFLGNLCITFILSTFLSLLFESPFVNLEKEFITRGKAS